MRYEMMLGGDWDLLTRVKVNSVKVALLILLICPLLICCVTHTAATCSYAWNEMVRCATSTAYCYGDTIVSILARRR